MTPSKSIAMTSAPQQSVAAGRVGSAAQFRRPLVPIVRSVLAVRLAQPAESQDQRPDHSDRSSEEPNQNDTEEHDAEVWSRVGVDDDRQKQQGEGHDLPSPSDYVSERQVLHHRFGSHVSSSHSKTAAMNSSGGRYLWTAT